jgi:predicted negative regulator of RcsB-dependent stress response
MGFLDFIVFCLTETSIRLWSSREFMSKKVPIKKLIRTNDAFLSTSDKVYNYYLANTKKIWGIAIGIVAACLVVLFVIRFHDARLQKASEAFSQALTIADPIEAAVGLDQVRAQYSGTPAARQASFALVNNYLDDDKIDEALTLLEELTGSLEPAEESLKPLLQSTLGALYEEKGQLEKALALYQSSLSLVQGGTPTQATQAFEAELFTSVGRVAMALGQHSVAKEAYEGILFKAPDSFRAYSAQIKLSEISSEISSEVNSEGEPGAAAADEGTQASGAPDAAAGTDSDAAATQEPAQAAEPTAAPADGAAEGDAGETTPPQADEAASSEAATDPGSETDAGGQQ